jgi:hypothetical protein
VPFLPNGSSLTTASLLLRLTTGVRYRVFLSGAGLNTSAFKAAGVGSLDNCR